MPSAYLSALSEEKSPEVLFGQICKLHTERDDLREQVADTPSASRLKELIDNEKTLHALYAAGVDSWEGYEMAMEGFDD